MNTRQLNSKQLVVALVFGVLATTALAGYWRLQASASAFRSTSRDLATCRRLVGEIDGLQEQPQFAALDSVPLEATAQRIQEASEKAGLEATSLIRIQPQSSSRIGNSPYRLRPTRLELRDVTLAQVTEFAYSLDDRTLGLAVRDLRLWSTEVESETTARETWSAEIILTQMVFSPITR